MPMFVVLLVLTLACIFCAIAITGRLNRLTSKSCAALLEDMCYVDMVKVCSIARGSGRETRDRLLTAEETWNELGGSEGIRNLRHNAGAMMEMARYLVLLNPSEHKVAHVVRADALRVRRMAAVLLWRHRLRRLRVPLPFSMSDLARAYLRVSVSTASLYLSLIDEVGPLLQASEALPRMLRTTSLPLT